MTNKNYILALMSELLRHADNPEIPRTYIVEQMGYIMKQIATNL